MSLSLYGKKVDDFDAVSEGFMAILADYSAQDVEDAFQHYIERNREFPAPTDIIRIICGDIKKDSFYYSQLMKRKGSLDYAESDYVKKYEKQTLDE